MSALTRSLGFVIAAAVCGASSLALAEAEFVVGSKSFTESVVLAELARKSAERDGVELVHHRELGGSRILFEALKQGEIDVYPEYTGTLIHELLASTPSEIRTHAEINHALEPLGLQALAPLGFENTYALGLKREKASKLGLASISDLASHPALKFGFSSEFMDREDGWPGLSQRYGLDPDWVRGMDHDLAYRALENGDIHVLDLYSTDADIAYYNLTTLKDDRRFFPEYKAFFIAQSDLTTRSPQLMRALESLSGAISEEAMVSRNARVKLERESEANSATTFLGMQYEAEGDTRFDRIVTTTFDHLTLVAISLFAAIVVAIPLGIAAARLPALG